VRSTLDDLFGPDTTEALERAGVLKVLRMADTYPCPRPGGDGCPRKVVECVDGSYVAVCGNDPSECDEVRLTPKAVEFLGVIPEKLFEALRGPLMIGGPVKKVDGVAQAYRIGAFVPQPGNTHPVYFVAASSGNQYAVAFDALRSRAEGQSFGLVTPTDRFLSEETSRQFRTLGIPVIPLANTVRLAKTGVFEAVADFLELFNSIGKCAAVEAGAQVHAQVRTSSGWQDLTEPQYGELIAQANHYTIFADERARTVSKQEGRQRKTFTNVQPAYFRILLTALEKRWRFDPATDRATGDHVAAKQVFQKARKAIDLRRKGVWALFKTEIVDKHAEYIFQPDSDVTFALIFLPKS
jgi:hypothetical protein